MIWVILILAIFAYVLVNAPADAADLSACRATKAVSNGNFCTIRPSDTDPVIRDKGTSVHGFGDHVAAFPKQSSGKLWVHFGGAGSTPYVSRARRVLNEVWLNELMGEGYTVVDVAYDTEFNITEACKGAAPDNCAGNLRAKLLTVGVDSIEHRLNALFAFFEMPALSWGSVSVSGHSQGAGYAYYVAKNYGAARACFLGGPYDIPDPVPKTRPAAQYIADWYLDARNETPIDRMGAFLTVQDAYHAQFTFAYGIMGLVEGVDWFEADKGRYVDLAGKVVDGHAASVQDPTLAASRAEACF